MQPGTFIVEPDLAERWEAPDDTTYVFHLRQGVKWHNKPPVNGRELVAEDVKFTFDRFLTEQGNPERQLLEPVDRVEVVDRYTVKFLLKEPFVWLLDMLANAMCMWIIAPEVVQQFGDLKKAETAIGTGPFLLERYEPNVKTVFKRNPDYFRQGLPYVDGVEWLVARGRIDRPGHVPHRATRRWPQDHWWTVRQQDLEALKKSHPQLLYQDFLAICGQWHLHAHRSAALQRRARAARHLPGHRSPGVSSRPSTSGANPPRRSAAAWPSGRCPSISSGRAPSTISTIPRKPGACWRKPAIPKALRRRSRVVQWLWPRPDRCGAVSAALSQRCGH